MTLTHGVLKPVVFPINLNLKTMKSQGSKKNQAIIHVINTWSTPALHVATVRSGPVTGFAGLGNLFRQTGLDLSDRLGRLGLERSERSVQDRGAKHLLEETVNI